MATLYITEYVAQPLLQGNTLAIPMEPPIAVDTVDVVGASVQSQVLNAKTTFVELHCDATCSYKTGSSNPTAVVTQGRLAQNSTKFIGVPPNSGWKIAGVLNT